jgi:hypothetical protein
MVIDRGKEDSSYPAPMGDCVIWPANPTFYPSVDTAAVTTWGDVTLDHAPPPSGHVVDGVIGSGEYDGGMAVQLVGRWDPLWTVDAFIDWDAEYLYVGVNEPVPATTGHLSWIEFAFDAGPARSVLDGFVLFDDGFSTHAECTKPPGSWGWTPYSFLAATGMATEFRVKYTDFGIALGDTIKMDIDRNKGPPPPGLYGEAAFWPKDSILYNPPDPTTWGTVTLSGPPPPSGHVVDGEIGPTEYDGGMAVLLVGRTDPTFTVDAFIDWDAEYLYVAVNEHVPPGAGTDSWIEFALDAGPSRAYLDAFVLFCSGAKHYVRYPKPGGPWGWVDPWDFLAATGMATEFRVKYTDFGIALGDTIKMSIDRNQGPPPPAPYGFAAFWPKDSKAYYDPPDPTTWGDVHLAPPTVQTTLYIDPPLVTKVPADVGTTFPVSVKIKDVTDLFGFDIKITWDNTLITFSSLDKTPLSSIWPQGFYEPLTPSPQTGPGYVRFAALATGGSGFTGSGTLFTMTFHVEEGCNFPRSTPIHFDTVVLSDSASALIDAVLTDGLYKMSATVPDLEFVLVDPTPGKPFEYCKTFEVEVYVTHISANLKDYDFIIDYNSELLRFVDVDYWGVLGGTSDQASYTLLAPGRVEVKDTGGIVWSGDRGLLFALTFHVEFNDDIGHIWRSTSPQQLPAQVSFEAAELSFLEGTVPMGGILMPSALTVTINLIQGDVDCDGNVDVFDLRAVAAYYDQTVPPAPAKYDIKTTNNIDIFDIVLVAAKFGYHNP